MYLVVGGAGYIGSQIVLDLLRDNKTVLVIDLDDQSINLKNLMNRYPNGELIFRRVDITDYAALLECLTTYREEITAVIHLAALKSVENSWLHPQRTMEVNTTGTYNLISAMAFLHIYNFIFASSGAVYSPLGTLPHCEGDYIESDPLHSPYAVSKLQVEGVLKRVAEGSEQWAIRCLRLFNVIGADPQGVVGERPVANATTLQARLFPRYGQLTNNIPIHYLQKERRTLEPARDYIHVADVSRAFRVVADCFDRAKDVGFTILNVCTGQMHGAREVVAAFEDQGQHLIMTPASYFEKLPGPLYSRGKYNKIERLYGWKPQYQMRDAVQHTLNFNQWKN